MESSNSSSKSALFKVYLRLRPPPPPNFSHQQPQTNTPDRFLSVEAPDSGSNVPTHITLNPPNDNRRRAVEKFAFTTVFEEDKNQLDVFEGTGVLGLIEGVLGNKGGDGRDGLLATLGVTGSGKSHTILGSRSQRGLTQLSLDVLFRSLGDSILDPATHSSLHATVAASDPSEAQVMSAQMFIDSMFADPANGPSRANSRAPTPMVVGNKPFRLHSNFEPFHSTSYDLYPKIMQQTPFTIAEDSRESIRVVPQDFPSHRHQENFENSIQVPGAYPASDRSSFMSSAVVSSLKGKLHLGSSPEKRLTGIPSYMSSTLSKARKHIPKSPAAKQVIQGETGYLPPPTPRRNLLNKPSTLPSLPDISNVLVQADPNAEYSILISMYEVYNDRIFDLLTPALPSKTPKDFRRRPLLFKPTEASPDRKVVAGLRKIICSSLPQALLVLEAGLHERRVAGTGSNSVSSRSHGFFCVEVKKRRRGGRGLWGGSALTVVDLAGSERARDAKTQGATLVEAGKINESLMYLGQCLQMQSDIGNSIKPNLVPFRQCKLTELLFSNSFPSTNSSSTTPSHLSSSSTSHPRNPQRGIMIVTADPLGDFNATSQILRYSALAREITVPRIPSVTSTILAQSTASHYFSQSKLHHGGPHTGEGRRTPSETERETMEIAALEIARMSEEIEGLRSELLVEQERRLQAEAKIESSLEREIELEADIREECYLEMEERMKVEMERYKSRWLEEVERGEKHIDRKLEILSRLDDNAEVDDEDKENQRASRGGVREEQLELENERLRREVEMLRREVQGRSPTKSAAARERLPLRESQILGGLQKGLEGLRVSHSSSGNGEFGGELLRAESRGGSGGRIVQEQQQQQRSQSQSPKKVARKLQGRKWGVVGEGEDEVF